MLEEGAQASDVSGGGGVYRPTALVDRRAEEHLCVKWGPRHLTMDERMWMSSIISRSVLVDVLIIRGATYAISATLRPLVGGVVLCLSECEANGGNGLRFAWNPPAIRSKAYTPAGNHTTEIGLHAHPKPGMVLVTPRGKAVEQYTSTKN